MHQTNRRLVSAFNMTVSVLVLLVQYAHGADTIIDETPAVAAHRHDVVASRRKGTDIICHRGASEHAFENTLEAFRATFELGGDGNEIDIRRTSDGVLVVFHDDMLDRNLEAYGDVSDLTWDELRAVPFRNPGKFGFDCRIPTLVDVFELHRQYGGLIHLDIKRPGLDQAIADLLTQMDMWDHVAYCNEDNGGVILRDPRLKLRQYKAGLYADRSEVFPESIAAALERPGDGVIVDDPRGTVLALGRKRGALSREPVRHHLIESGIELKPTTEAELIAILRDSSDWDRVMLTAENKAASGQKIRDRALAAERLLGFTPVSDEAVEALKERVRFRSLHRDWMFHGFDGAMALRTLILMNAPGAVELARETLWRDDPALDPVVDARWKNPRSWTDFRVKMVIFPSLKFCPGQATEQLCRDYLALSDEEASKICPPSFQEAAQALLAVSPKSSTAVELLTHRLQAVRGRAILDCLAQSHEPWAIEALKTKAPHALDYRVDLLIADNVVAEDIDFVEFDQLIDSLASKNGHGPKIAEVTDKGKSITIPIFPDDFDFEEQMRVRDQLVKLARSDSNKIWPRLLAHLGDTRYSLTVMDENDDVHSMTVGDWCREVAERDLYAAYLPHVPQISGLERRGQFLMVWTSYRKPIVLTKEWRERNANKALWELQIEFCEWAITEAPGLKQVSEEARTQFVGKIHDEIERLKTSHEPAINKSKLTHEGRSTVTEKMAKRLTEKYQRMIDKSKK